MTPTEWLDEVRKPVNRVFLRLHVAVTLIAYAIFVGWLVTGTATVGFAFLEVWWVAVIFGVLMGY